MAPPSNTLGSPTSTFGPSLRITGVLAAAGILLCVPALMIAYLIKESTVWGVGIFLGATFVALLVWQLSFRAAIHESGISCRNLLFSKEWPWNEIDRVYYSVLAVQTRFIPFGEFYRLNLQNVYGHTLSFSNHFSRHEELAISIGQCTFKRIAENAFHSFDSGSPVDFGAITISRTDGVTLNKRLFQRKIPWEKVMGYEVTSSTVSFSLRQGIFTQPTAPREELPTCTFSNPCWHSSEPGEARGNILPSFIWSFPDWREFPASGVGVCWLAEPSCASELILA